MERKNQHKNKTMIDKKMVTKVQDLLGMEGYNQAFATITQASGLPNVAYRSDEWLQLEQERILARSWVFAGAAAEIPEIGDLKPIEIAGSPLIIVRTQNRKIQALHNVCRHRGARLITQKCRKSSFTCPYHAWNYRLDGTLQARPHFQGPNKIDRFAEAGGGEQLDLRQVRTETWNGCIFVNLSGKAEPLEEWLAPMLARTQNYDFSQISWVGKVEFHVRANWKLVYENYMEGYHVFSVHPQLLKFAPMDIRWAGEWKNHVFYNDYIVPKLEAGRGKGLPHYPGLSEEDTRRGLWFLCFPHFAAEVFPDQFALLVSYPIAPDLTREELHVFVVNNEAMADKYQKERANLLQLWDDLNREDVGMLELLQQGRLSPAYDGGRLSPYWEVPTHQFGQRIINKIIAQD